MSTSLYPFAVVLALPVALSLAPPLAAQDAEERASAGPDGASIGVPTGVSAEDWTSIRAAWQATRHAVIEVDGAYRANNPNQRLTADFDRRGATVTPASGDWSWGLTLQSWGFEGALQVAPEETAPAANDGRVAYHWSPQLTEWWINDACGLEHGFTVHERPDSTGETAGRSLVFAIDVQGGLRPMVGPERRSLTFVDEAGRTRLHYSGLVALDADGASLDTWIETTGTGFELFVREESAHYPLTIDPLVQQEAYVKASNTDARDEFGTSVAISGDTLIVGAPFEDSNATGVNGNQADNSSRASGAAYVFVRNGAVWTQEAYIKASNPGADDQFGNSVAISGDTVVMGALGESSNATGINGNQSDNSSLASGAAYVFVRVAGVWTQEAYLKASNTGATDLFGGAVGISGDTIVVGSYREDSAATGVNGNQSGGSALDAGAAYVFVRNGGVWTQEAYLKASNTEARDEFGHSVSVSGDSVAVGAWAEASGAVGIGANQADNSAPSSGAVYVFARSGGAWAQEAYIKASNTDAGDAFGWSIAIDGGSLAVGAIGERSIATGVNGNQLNNQHWASGAVYVFVRNSGPWWQEAYLKASNSDTFDQFGGSVALSGDTLVVGARFEASYAMGINGVQTNESAFRAGAAYLFVRSVSVWAQEAYLKASNTDGLEEFGAAVAISGDRVVVGAPFEDSDATGVNGDDTSNGARDSGAAYVFDLDAPGDLGTSYCSSNANSTGAAGEIEAYGSAVAADNDITLTGVALPRGSFGFFMASRNQGFVMNPGGSAGNLCLGGMIGRYTGPGQVVHSGSAGTFSLVLDLTATPTPTGFVSVQAGETWNYQAWYRDAVGGAATSNFTNGLEILFQ